MLVITGAFYYIEGDDMIVVPHYTGEFCIVDCDTYERLEILEDKYNEGYIEEAKKNLIECDGEKYYPTEYSPTTVDEHWVLLSDLSELRHTEEEYDF